MSLVRPERPRRPDFVFSKESMSLGERFSLVAMKSGRAGSRSPDRVPMTSPSSGVSPMEVSTGLPLRIAAAEQPLPR